MRELKFRAWVKYTTDHRWEYAYSKAENEKLEHDIEEELRNIYLEEWDKNNSQDKRFSHKEYMANWDEVKISLSGNITTLINLEVLAIIQYTGLKDKNGKEIYEGDIVQQFDFEDPWFRNQVLFTHGAFGYISNNSFITYANNFAFEWNEGKSEHIEIIGNIYENPELVKS